MLDVEGRVSSWTTGAKRIKGYSADEIIGHHFSRFYTEADRAAGVPARALGTAADEGKYETEGWRLRKDGSRFWASVIIDPIRDQSGKLVGYAKVTRDITDGVKVEEALEQTRAAFVQSQKMEAVGQLTGGVAHDFNNLLTVITNALDLLSRPKIEEHQRNRIIETAQRAAARGAKLTQQLLAFSRRQPLRPQAHRLNELIRGFDAVLRRACGEASELDLRFAARPLGVNVDGPQFEAALLNLTLNSRDAMPQGGKLRIATDLQTIHAARPPQLSVIKTAPSPLLTADNPAPPLPPTPPPPP